MGKKPVQVKLTTKIVKTISSLNCYLKGNEICKKNEKKGKIQGENKYTEKIQSFSNAVNPVSSAFSFPPIFHTDWHFEQGFV